MCPDGEGGVLGTGRGGGRARVGERRAGESVSEAGEWGWGVGSGLRWERGDGACMLGRSQE